MNRRFISVPLSLFFFIVYGQNDLIIQLNSFEFQTLITANNGILLDIRTNPEEVRSWKPEAESLQKKMKIFVRNQNLSDC